MTLWNKYPTDMLLATQYYWWIRFTEKDVNPENECSNHLMARKGDIYCVVRCYNIEL